MVLEFLFFSLKLVFLVIILLCWYQSLDRFNYLFNSNSSINFFDLTNYSFILLKYPLVLILSIFIIGFIIFQNFDKNANYNNLLIVRYFLFNINFLIKYFFSYLIIKFKKFFVFFLIYNFEKKYFVIELKNFFGSFFLLWRPLFKRISYFGKLMKGSNIWKN